MDKTCRWQCAGAGPEAARLAGLWRCATELGLSPKHKKVNEGFLSREMP